MKASSPKTVDDYLKQFPEPQKTTLEKVRKAIRDAAPQAEEIISYGIAGYKLNGPVAYFAGFKNHCSYFPGSYGVIKSFQKELESYEISKGTIHFPVNKPLPAALIKKMILAKIKENEERLQARKQTKPGEKKTLSTANK